jgi:uncharacterized protein involved in exopolysaccharide biosynthesis
MAEPDDMIIPMLREMRSEIAASRADMAAFRKEVGERFAGIEALQTRIAELEAQK